MIMDMENQIKVAKRDNVLSAVEQNDVLTEKQNEMDGISNELISLKFKLLEHEEKNKLLILENKDISSQLEDCVKINQQL